MTTPFSLREFAARCGLPVGAAVDMKALAEDAAYAETLRREFDMVVAENAYKQFAVWVGPRTYDFTETDRLAAFARENGMTLRGHTLLWHQAIPKWLREGDYAGDEVRTLLREYIHAFVGRYRGQVAMWDVVNEAVEDPGPEGAAPGLREEESFWHRMLGPDYLRLAFAWAHDADPAARLYYNDYEIENLGPKSDAVYALLRDLLAQGAPVHGIGFQGHLVNGWRATDGHRANIRRFARLGLDWQITECDVRMVLNGQPATPEALAAQADAYGDLIRLCRTEPGCRGFVTWGFTDAHSWIPGFRPGQGAALPLDEQYRPKPAYDAMVAALREGGEPAA